MEKILKKALDEALTERYSGELNSASEVNHAFSGDFERKMKALIRRTDKPLLYYSKYIAAAACAVVAIGCAVLLPALTGNRIEVNSPTDMAAAETTAGAFGADSNNIAAITTTAPVTSPADIETTAEQAGNSETAETAENAPENSAENAPAEEKPVYEEAPPATENTVKEETPKDDNGKSESSGEDITEESAEEETEDEDIFDEAEADESFDVTDNEEATDGSDDDIGDEYNPSTGPGTGWEEDDDAVIEEDDDADIDGEAPFHPSGSENDQNPGCGGGSDYEYKPFPEAADFGGIISLTYGGSYEDLRAAACTYNNNIYLSFGDTNTDFVQDFIASLKTAKVIAAPEAVDESEMITLSIQNIEPTATERRSENFSDSLFYGETFGTGEDADMPEEEDSIWEQEQSTLSCYLEIFSDGNVRLVNILNSAEKTEYYSLNTYLKADKTATAKLFGKLKALVMPDNAKTAGDLIRYYDIKKSNLDGVLADVSGIYDTGYSALSVSGETIEKFFAGCASAPLTADTTNEGGGFGEFYSVEISNCSPNETYENRKWWFNDFYGGESKICLRLPIKNKGGAILATVTRDSCYIRNEYCGGFRNREYCFTIKPESAAELFKTIMKENNIIYTSFVSLSDYLTGKNLTTPTSGVYNKVTGSTSKKTDISDIERLKQLITAIKSEAKTAKYQPMGEDCRRSKKIALTIGGWKYVLAVYDNDYISIGNNYFKASDGFYDKLIAIIEG